MASLRNTDPVNQVIGQINSVYELIKAAQESHRFDTAAFLKVNYEDMCQDPAQTLARIRDFIPYCRARPESIGSLPTDFKIRRTSVKDPQLNAILQQRLIPN